MIEGLTIPKGALLVAIDIEALYSSIPHRRGVEVISTFLYEQDRSCWPLMDFVVKLLDHILIANIFLFNGTAYLQVQGVSIGTYCAPSYAKLYLGGWERSLFSDDTASIYVCHILLW